MAGQVAAAGHAFISYVREDADAVDRLQDALEQAQIPVWRDTRDLRPGDDWQHKIGQAIRADSLAFIACFSTRSEAKAKSYQREELILAIEQLRLRSPDLPWLIPVRLDDCSVPELDIGAGRTLSRLHWVDLFGDRWDKSCERLVDTVRRILPSRHEDEDEATEVVSRPQSASGHGQGGAAPPTSGTAREPSGRLDQEDGEQVVIAERPPGADPTEWLVRVVAHVVAHHVDDRSKPPLERVADIELLHRLVPDVDWPRLPTSISPLFSNRYSQDDPVGRWRQEVLRNSPPWGHAAVASWFRRAVAGRPPPHTIQFPDKRLCKGEPEVVKTRTSRGQRVFEVPGWIISRGSTLHGRGRGAYRMHVGITRQGQVLHSAAHLQDKARLGGFDRHDEGGFNAGALRQMARIVDLPALDVTSLRP